MELVEILVASIKFTVLLFIIVIIPSYVAFRLTRKKKIYNNNASAQRLYYTPSAPVTIDEKRMKRFKVVKINYNPQSLADSAPDIDDNDGSYEFSNKDISLILFYINRIRGIVRTSNEISYNYKQRLFVKLNNLQGELQKRMSTLNNMYGYIVDIAVSSSGIDKEIGPLLNDILKITAETQAFADNVPPPYFTAGTPLRIIKLNPEYIKYAAENNLHKQMLA